MNCNLYAVRRDSGERTFLDNFFYGFSLSVVAFFGNSSFANQHTDLSLREFYFAIFSPKKDIFGFQYQQSATTGLLSKYGRYIFAAPAKLAESFHRLT